MNRSPLIITIVYGKGGVGKTTTAVNTAYALTKTLPHRDGRPPQVLLIDGDPQGSASKHCGVPKDVHDSDGPTMGNVLTGRWTGPIGDMIVEVRDGLHVIPAHEDMVNLTKQLNSETGREFLLSRLIDDLVDAGVFDAVVIDTPPALNLLTDNALYAVRHREGVRSGVIMAAMPDAYCPPEAANTFRHVQRTAEALMQDIPVIGIVINGFNKAQGTITNNAAKALHDSGLPVLQTFPWRVAFREAVNAGMPVALYDPTSDVGGMYEHLSRKICEALEEEEK